VAGCDDGGVVAGRDPLIRSVDDGFASASVQAPYVNECFVAHSLTLNVEKCRFFTGSVVFIILAATSGNRRGAVQFIFKGVVDDLIGCREGIVVVAVSR
jgi:hypothetical protein